MKILKQLLMLTRRRDGRGGFAQKKSSAQKRSSPAHGKYDLRRLAAWIFATMSLSFTVYWFGTTEERSQRQAERVEAEKIDSQNQTRTELRKHLGPAMAENQFPKTFSSEELAKSYSSPDKEFSVEYSINESLQKDADKLLAAYKPDYGAVVMMDALTGKILALSSYQRGTGNKENLNFKNSFPAASVFKIITASAAVDRKKLNPDTIVMFNGANHTLYKKNVMTTKVNRWTREMTLKEAFARSVNTFFGRLTLEHLEPKDLEEYAIRFGFNRQITTDMPFDLGFTAIPSEKSFQLVEIASGFNRVTRMSPLQGAMIAASVAADGVMRVPYVVESVKDSAGKTVFKSEPIVNAQTLTPEGAERLKALMEATVHMGTSRSSFRPLTRSKKYEELELGGKTGSLMGDNPKGKTDWFVGYAIGGQNDRVAVAAVTVNKEYWTVKAAYLAQSLFQRHFKDQFSERNRKFFNASNDH